MAAIKRRRREANKSPRTSPHALIAAALALPGIMPSAALAESAPDKGTFSIVYGDYRDWQEGANRMKVHTPTMFVMAPLSDSLAVQGSLTYDAISGASPYYHNSLSGASIGDYRTAGDFKVTKWLGPWAIGLGAAVSKEQDYRSRAASLDVRYSTPDNNRTYAFSVGGASDDIDSVNFVAVDEHRQSFELMIGITQVLNADAIVQSNLTYYTGHGYYSDPYKVLDTRPDHRRTLAWLTRYNQSFPGANGVLQLGYRLLSDSFGDQSNMLEATWVQGLPQEWSVAPIVRYLTQHKASFYFDPPFPIGYGQSDNYTADTRLSSFGAITAGLTIGKSFTGGWSSYAKYEFYRQRSSWHLGGGGSPDLLDVSARWFEVGLSKTF